MTNHYEAIKNGVPWGIRTLDPLLRRQLLYPTELRRRYDWGNTNEFSGRLQAYNVFPTPSTNNKTITTPPSPDGVALF